MVIRACADVAEVATMTAQIEAERALAAPMRPDLQPRHIVAGTHA
jgi:hypothetical protein